MADGGEGEGTNVGGLAEPKPLLRGWVPFVEALGVGTGKKCAVD